MQITVIAVVGSFVLGLGLGAVGGHEFATGRAAKADVGRAEQSAKDALEGLDIARRQLERSSRDLARSATRDAETASRHLSEAAKYEQIISLAARAECVRDDESFRLLIGAISRANERVFDLPGAVAVPPDVRSDAGSHRKE